MDMCQRCARGLAQQAQTSWAHFSCPAGSCRQRSAVPPASHIFLGFLVVRRASLRPTVITWFSRSSYSSSKNGKSWSGSPLTRVTRLLLAKHREADDQGQVVQLGAFLLGHFVAQCSNACLEQITWNGLNG